MRTKLPGVAAGYIIGLGDRHSHNILLERRTAEVVHIDLGVAFEQGRFLNTPELVPFRLTSNIVDGMGATGASFITTACCLTTAHAHGTSCLTLRLPSLMSSGLCIPCRNMAVACMAACLIAV